MQISNNNNLNFGLTIKPTTFRIKEQKNFLHECIDKYDSELLWLDRNLLTSGTGDMLIKETEDGNTQISINFHNFSKQPVKQLQKVFNLKKDNFENIKGQLMDFIKQGNFYQRFIFDNAKKSPRKIHDLMDYYKISI